MRRSPPQLILWLCSPLRLLELRNWIYFGKTFGMWSRIHMMIWRSVCTISALSVDEEGLCVGLGSNGDLELWDRRKLERVWRYHAHDDGVYGIDMNSVIVVSVGDDGLVNIYDRFHDWSTWWGEWEIIWCFKRPRYTNGQISFQKKHLK